MDLLADRTGGHAFHNTNDIQGAIRRTLAESTSSYQIGFYPDDGNWNGEFHELKIKAKEAGLTLRYRKGYYALADPPNTVDEARNSLKAALWSPVDANGLGIQARIRSADAETRKVEVRVRLEVSELRLNSAGNRHVGNIDAVYVQLGPGDALLKADPLSYKLDWNEKEYQASLTRGYELVAPLLIRPTCKALRFGARQRNRCNGKRNDTLENYLPDEAAGNRGSNTH